MNRQRLPWWRRPIDEKKLGVLGTRAGAMLVIAVVAVLVENPWVILALLAVAAAGFLVALALRRSNRSTANFRATEAEARNKSRHEHGPQPPPRADYPLRAPNVPPQPLNSDTIAANGRSCPVRADSTA